MPSGKLNSMSKLTCKSVLAELPDYIGAHCDAATAREIRAHLQNCSSCAEEEQRLRVFIEDQLAVLPRREQADVDWSAFSVRLNDEIDHRQQKKSSRARFVPLYAYALPAAAILVALAIWLLPFPENGDAGRDALPVAVTLEAADVQELADDGLSTVPLSDVTITMDAPSNLHASGLLEDTVLVAQETVSNTIASSLTENLGYADLIEASLQYFSTEQVLENISDEDIELLASALEFEDIDLR